MKELGELAREDREAAIRLVMETFGYDRARAERLVAIQLGEDLRDVVDVDERGNERPYEGGAITDGQ